MPLQSSRINPEKPLGRPAAPSSVPACGWAGPGLLYSLRPEPPGPSSSGTGCGPPAGSGWLPQTAIPSVRTCWQRRSGFLPGFRHQCNKVRRKEGSGQGWLVKTQVFLLTQINSHRCALCVTWTHQLSRLSQRSLSVFVPAVSLLQLVRPSLHSVSLNELPFHGGFYPVSTPITAIRHRWSSFCTWPTYLPLSPESFSRCRLRWTTPPSPQCFLVVLWALAVCVSLFVCVVSICSVFLYLFVLWAFAPSAVKLMKMSSWFAGAFSVCMCFLKLQHAELSQPPCIYVYSEKKNYYQSLWQQKNCTAVLITDLSSVGSLCCLCNV